MAEPNDPAATGLRSNFYIALIASAGDGVTHPAQAIRHILAAIGRADTVCGAYASREGVEDNLARHTAALFLPDSFAHYLTSYSFSPPEMVQALLALFSGADSIYPRHVGKEPIHEPCLNLLSNAPHHVLNAALRQGAVESGLLSRFLFIVAPLSGRNARPASREVPDSILAVARQWAERPANPQTVAMTDEAKTLMAAWRTHTVEKRNHHASTSDMALASLWGRAGEHAAKLAMLHAVSADAANPIIDAAAVRWATALVVHLLTGMERRVNEALAERD